MFIKFILNKPYKHIIRGAFPNENSVYKVLYLRIRELKEKWKKPIQNWKTIQSQITELFGERYTKYLEI